MMILPGQSLSSLTFISSSNFPSSLPTNFSNLSISTTSSPPFLPSPIRMGGGPRTFPGGVSKWQWKRMQAKKSKQLLKARLARERQIYEMRKRAELKASLSELERPWEVVEKAPTLFSVKADEQLKVLADRFQKPGGFDMWGEEDGPELFKNDGEGKTARFFPKGVVHSVKPYGGIEGIGDGLNGSRLVLDCEGEDGVIDWRSVMGRGGSGSDLRAKSLDKMVGGGSSENRMKGNVFKKRRESKRYLNGEEGMSLREGVLEEGNGRRDSREVYDKREYRKLDGMNGSREIALDKGSGRRNMRGVYKKREFRRQDNMNGSEGMSSRDVALDEGSGRRNLYKNGYRMQNSSNALEGMSSGEGVLDEGSGRRNPRQVYKKNEYRMQNSSNGSERMSSRDEGSGRNLRQVYNKREYRMQNSSEEVKRSTKAEVYDLRLERDGRYEFRPEN